MGISWRYPGNIMGISLWGYHGDFIRIRISREYHGDIMEISWGYLRDIMGEVMGKSCGNHENIKVI